MRAFATNWPAALFVAATLGALGWSSGCSSDGAGANSKPGDNPGENRCGADLSADLRNCGACGHACEANHYCKSGACEPGCPDRVLYVSNQGDDHNYGCSQVAPRKTVSATIALARDLGLRSHEIRVCRGTYVEPGLALDHPVSLRGGYDCTSWSRAPVQGEAQRDGGGSSNETVLEQDEEAELGPTFSIRGATVGPEVSVDGLTIRGGKNSRGGGAVLISTGASPALTNVTIVGGSASGAGDSVGSYGIYVQAGASPEITASRIHGGSGTAQGSFGSVGIALASDAGQPRIHGNRIDGGTGTTTSGIASAGLLLSGKAGLEGERAVADNVIHGGTGKVLGASGMGSVGVFINDAAAIDLVNNVIDVGTSTCAGACAVRGVSVNRTERVRIAKNRIYGGDATPRAATAWGVLVAESSGTILENNMIHGGGKAKPLSAVYAVELSESSGGQVRGNTLYSSLAITRQSSGVSVENNLLIGSRSPTEVALLVFACPAGSAISSFRNNVFANFSEPFAAGVTTTSVACDTRNSFTTVAALEQFLTTTAGGAGARVRGDARIDTGAKAIFAAWTDAESGYPELVKTGWRLDPKVPCAVARGGLESHDALSSDAFGTARQSPFSVGAEELADKSACTK